MPGDALGGVPDRPAARPGGIAIRVNGAEQGVRDNVNFVDTPGVVWTGQDDVGNSRVDVRSRIQGEVLLAPAIVGLDLLAVSLQDLIASGALGVNRAQVSRVLLVASNVSGVTTQPIIEVGTDLPGNPPNDDVSPSGGLSLTATGELEEIPILALRPTLVGTATPDGVLTLRVTNTPGATNYLVDVYVLGTVITP